ncbi:MAG: hypothetical protein DMG83_08830 [Acidobacteria bacterium]|nr:MAG: hypothetical protein DMG83_08830 [Acidobacteriota bacterium]
MSDTYTSNLLHCVFSTKQRAAIIPADRLEHLWAYLLGIARNMKIKILAIGGTSDHLHLLIALPPTMSLAKVICDMKANSSKWLNESRPAVCVAGGLRSFQREPLTRRRCSALHPQSG